MQQKGDPNRLTMEETIAGKANEAQQQLENDMAEPNADEWVKTSYIVDITMPYGQVISETSGGNTTNYTYGMDRIDALNSQGGKTQYVYDGARVCGTGCH